MNKPDFSLQYSSSDNTITYISALTISAQPNSEFEAHAHCDEFEIYHFLEGDLFFAFEGRRIAIEDGALVIICSSTLHRPIIKNPCKYYRKRILFKKEVFTRLNTADFELYNRLRKRKILILKPETVQVLEIDKMLTDIEQSLSVHSSYEDFCALVTLFSLLIKAEKNCEPSDLADFHMHSGKSALHRQIISKMCGKSSLRYSYRPLPALPELPKPPASYSLSSQSAPAPWPR